MVAWFILNSLQICDIIQVLLDKSPLFNLTIDNTKLLK